MSNEDQGSGRVRLPTIEEAEARYRAATRACPVVTEQDWLGIRAGLSQAIEDGAPEAIIHPPLFRADKSPEPDRTCQDVRVAWCEQGYVKRWADEVQGRLEELGYRVTRGRKYGLKLIVRGWRERAEDEVGRCGCS